MTIMDPLMGEEGGYTPQVSNTQAHGTQEQGMGRFGHNKYSAWHNTMYPYQSHHGGYYPMASFPMSYPG